MLDHEEKKNKKQRKKVLHHFKHYDHCNVIYLLIHYYFTPNHVKIHGPYTTYLHFHLVIELFILFIDR